jgi:hypothetical protein
MRHIYQRLAKEIVCQNYAVRRRKITYFMVQQMKLELQHNHRHNITIKFRSAWQLYVRDNYYSVFFLYALAALKSSGCPYYDDIVCVSGGLDW